MDARLVTRAEAAETLGVHRATAYRMSKKNDSMTFTEGRLLFAGGEVLTDEESLLSLLHNVPDQGELDALRARISHLEQELQLARHETEMATQQAVSAATMLAEIVDHASQAANQISQVTQKASFAMRDQLMRGQGRAG